MTPVQSKGVDAAVGRAASLFEATSYADWARGAIRARTADPDLAILFDSTMREPTAELAAVARAAFGPEVTSRYVSVFADGNPFAQAALARRYGLDVDQILTTTGATAALALVLKALLRPGDEVLTETPGFDIHSRMIAEAGGSLRTFARPAPDFGIDLGALQAALTPRTRVVVVTNLHNPSGAYLPPDALAGLAAILEPAGAVLVVDEVYAEFARDRGDPPAARLGPNIVSVSSLTKVFGLFALKFGWLAAAPDLTARIRGAAPDGDMAVSKLTHALAAHVLEAPGPFEAHWRNTLAETREAVRATAEQLVGASRIEGDVPPFGCMYFPRVVGVSDTLGLARDLFERHRVLVAPGEYFGAPGHIRIGFGADPPQIAEGLRRLATALLPG